MANELTREEESAMRLMGRQMAESSVRNVSSSTDSAGSTVYRETGRVITVYEEGRLDLNLGDDWTPLIVESVPYTTACTGVQAGDTVILETFGHRMVAVGIVATSSDPQYRPATQDKVDEVDGKADSAISKADENAADIIKAQKSVEEAASKADDAAAKAQSATDAASKAQTAADAAQASAETASSAATEAKTKAEDAAAKITVIEGNITEIDAASKEAKDAADKAQTTADAANETATKANEAIAETNKQVTNIADEMATVKEDAIKTRDDLTEQIQTVTDTMTADYAKKTELTETEANLKTEISKSAAGVLSEVSSNYSTKVELDKVQEAADTKARVFTEQPTPPYAAGDLWVQGESGEIMRCIMAKAEGEEYAATDWDKASKYTDDSSVTELANTVEKTYATQSTVEQLSDRIEQTVSAVETVKVDAAAAQKKADEASATAATAKETADTAKANADTAQGKADDAAAAAKTAQDAADTAKSDASAAQTAADTAKQAAETAQTAATAAQEKANTAAADAKTANDDLAVAKKNLEAVQNQANATDTQVAAAQAAVVKAQDAADKANEAATTAQTAADAAKETAASAKTNADAAQETANAAKESAVSAATAAETAKTNAAAAQATADTAAETANTAVTNAANAQADADKANEAIADLTDRVTTAETSIKQNADAIELKASKTELEDGVADAKSYSDSQLAVKADEITASVETAQAGVDTLESMVRVYGEGVEVAKKVNGAYTSSKAVITDETFSIVAQDGTELASYGKDMVYLGKNSQKAEIKFCGGKGWIYYHQDDDSTNEYLTMMNPYGGLVLAGGTHHTELSTGRSYLRFEEGIVSLRPQCDTKLLMGRNVSGQCAYIEVDKMNGPITLCADDGVYVNSLSTFNGRANFNYGVVANTVAVSGATSTNTLSVSSTAKVGVATTGTYALPNLSGAGKWVKLGWWSSSSDSNSLIIDLHTGNGYNGRVDQNCHARITVKNSAETTAGRRFGGTLEVVAGDGCDASGMQLALPSSSTDTTDVYVYLPWRYTKGWMQVSCNGGTWNADVKESNYPTSGYTLQPVGWTAPVVSGLYWGTTLLGGRVGVKLWSGTLSKGGSITVSNLNRYRVLMVVCNSIDEAGLMAMRSDSIYCTAGWAYDNGSTSYVYKATFRKDSTSGTKLTLVSASRHTLTTNCPGESQNVVALWGLI